MRKQITITVDSDDGEVSGCAVAMGIITIVVAAGTVVYALMILLSA